MRMDVEELEGGVTWIRFAGELDAVGAAQLGGRFAAAARSKRRVVADLGQLEALTAAGVRCLLAGIRAVYRGGGRIVLLDPGEPVLSVLQSFAIDALVPIVGGRDQALATLLLVSARRPSCGRCPFPPAAARRELPRLPSPV